MPVHCSAAVIGLFVVLVLFSSIVTATAEDEDTTASIIRPNVALESNEERIANGLVSVKGRRPSSGVSSPDFDNTNKSVSPTATVTVVVGLTALVLFFSQWCRL